MSERSLTTGKSADPSSLPFVSELAAVVAEDTHQNIAKYARRLEWHDVLPLSGRRSRLQSRVVENWPRGMVERILCG